MTRSTFDATRGVERLPVRTLLGVLVLPVLVGLLLAWGLSSPLQNLDRVTVAVVNDDVPVTVNGQTVPMGRQFAAGLLGGPAGSGAPDDPTASTTTTSVPDSETTVLGSSTSSTSSSTTTTTLATTTTTSSSDVSNFTWVLTNDDDAESGLENGTYDAVLTIPQSFSADATSITGPAEDAVQASVNVVMAPSAASLDEALAYAVVDAAVSTLNQNITVRYLTSTYQGFDQISASMVQASDGANQLAEGTESLSSGADQLASGADELASGLDSLSTGAQTLSDGLAQLDQSVQPLPNETEQLADGSAQVAEALDAAASELDAATGAAADVVASICQNPGPLCDQATDALAQLQTADDAVDALASGADQVAQGNAQLAEGMPALVEGIDSSAEGAAEVASGAESSASGGASVAEGAENVASGADQANSGAQQLAEGLAQGVDQIPTFSDQDIETVSPVVATPTTATFEPTLEGIRSVPLSSVLALWIGGIVVALAHSAVARSQLLTSRSSASLALRSTGTVAAIGAGQGLAVGLALLPFADIQTLWAYLGASIFVGLVFGVINTGLAALLGGFGRMIAVFVALVGVIVGVVSTAPAALETLAALLPTTPAGTLLRSSIGVGSGWGAFTELVLWGAFGLLFVVVGTAVRRHGDGLLARDEE